MFKIPLLVAEVDDFFPFLILMIRLGKLRSGVKITVAKFYGKKLGNQSIKLSEVCLEVLNILKAVRRIFKQIRKSLTECEGFFSPPG